MIITARNYIEGAPKRGILFDVRKVSSFGMVALVLLLAKGDGLTLQPHPMAPTPPGGPHRHTALGYANEAMSPSVVSPFRQRHPRPSQAQPRAPPPESQSPGSLVGQVILDGKYVLTKRIPVASPKCQIYEAFPMVEGRVQERKPFIVKLSTLIDEGIDQELANYRRILGSGTISSKQRAQQLFVKVYDAIPASPWTHHQAGLVMEKGTQNLRSFIRKHGPYQGDALRYAMRRVIECVDVLHSQNLVWTELKPENFIVTDAKGIKIKGIDLESVIPEHGQLKVYTAESCPPEFPLEEMYKTLPTMQISSKFDIWGLGLVLFEMATGEPMYVEGLTDLEYIKHRLRNVHDLVSEIQFGKLRHVDSAVADLIVQCLQVQPSHRASTSSLLQHPVFDTVSFSEASYVNKSIKRAQYHRGRQQKSSAQSILHSRYMRSHPRGHAVKNSDHWQQVQRSPSVTTGKSYVSYAASSHRASTSLSTASATREFEPLPHSDARSNLAEAGEVGESTDSESTWKDQLVNALDTIHQFALEDPEIASDLVNILDQAQSKLGRSANADLTPSLA